MEQNRNRVSTSIEATLEVTPPNRMASHSAHSFLGFLGPRIFLCITYIALFMPRTTEFIVNVEYRNHQDPRRHRIRVLIRRHRGPRRPRVQFDLDNAPRQGGPPRRSFG